VGDWNGDGRTDLGTFDPATGQWTLRVRSGGSYVSRTVQYGGLGDLPAVGDWNGNGVSDLGVWRMRTAVFYKRVPSAPGSYVSRTTTYGARR